MRWVDSGSILTGISASDSSLKWNISSLETTQNPHHNTALAHKQIHDLILINIVATCTAKHTTSHSPGPPSGVLGAIPIVLGSVRRILLGECKRRFLKTEFGPAEQYCIVVEVWALERKVGAPCFSKAPLQRLNAVSKLVDRTQIFLVKWSYEKNKTGLLRCHTNFSTKTPCWQAAKRALNCFSKLRHSKSTAKSAVDQHHVPASIT